MSISIITPHFNNLEGIKKTFEYLSNQSSNQWEWIIVDDFSDKQVKDLIGAFFDKINSSQIQLIFNTTKTNASVCRNLGIDYASHSKLVFLDSDDVISDSFVKNRLVEVKDFTVFSNSNVLNEKGENIPKTRVTSNYLDHFLRANFIWPITSILWNKSFLIKIGKFNPELQRLQDVELAIRALFLGENYQVINNEVDFYYNVSPIRTRKSFVVKVTSSVNYLLQILQTKYDLTKKQQHLIKGYYYLCVKYLHRSKNRKDASYVRESLKFFYTKKYLNPMQYFIGWVLLKFYDFKLISDDVFLKVNRYFFK